MWQIRTSFIHSRYVVSDSVTVVMIINAICIADSGCVGASGGWGCYCKIIASAVAAPVLPASVVLVTFVF